MDKLEKYSSYKESGVEWLGGIPSEWETLANKHIFKIKQNLVGKKSGEYDLLSLTLKGIIKRDMDDPKGKFPAEFDTYQEVKKDDFVFCLFDVEETPRTVGLSKYDGMITGAYTVMQTKDISKEYLYYFYLNLDASKRFKPLYKGLRNTISKDSFFSFKTFIPPKLEQTKIALFLDTKTEQLDKAIKQKEQLIELLKERRQILINDAVTKGIDKTVTMKDSGVEWIGEIPEHWNIVPGFTVYKENKTKNTGMKDDRVLSLSYGKIVVKPKEKLTGLVPESFETYQIVKPGDIIIRCMDLQNDQTSLRTAISVNDGIITSAYLNLNIIDDFNSDYLHYYLHSLDITKVLYKFGSGLRQNLSYEDFKRLPIVKPSKVKQQEIVEYIENNNQKIDKAIDLQQQQITKLKEYKTTLIDSVVTGKVKVV